MEIITRINGNGKLITVYHVTPTDTRRIRDALKAEGLVVHRCQLGSNRFYILVHTSDNLRAVPVIERLGYRLDPIWSASPADIFQIDKMKFEKVMT